MYKIVLVGLGVPRLRRRAPSIGRCGIILVMKGTRSTHRPLQFMKGALLSRSPIQ